MLKRRTKCCNCGFLGVHHRLDELSESFSDAQRLSAQARLDVPKWLKTQDAMLSCYRGLEYSLMGMTSPDTGYGISDFHKAIVEPRRCKFYYPYDPGYTPRQHLELQREAKTQRLLLIGMLSAALIGALAAILAQPIGQLIGSLIAR